MLASLTSTGKTAICIAATMGVIFLGWLLRPAPATTETITITPLDVFAFEHGYIWGLTGRTRKTAANLWMLYPGAEPKNKHNRNDFKKPGWADDRLVTFQILPKNDEARGIYLMREANARKAGPAAVIGGLELLGVSYNREYFKVSRPIDSVPYIVCSIERPGFPYPGCTKYASVSSRLTISFNFSRRRLSEWNSIQSELLVLIQSKRIEN